MSKLEANALKKMIECPRKERSCCILLKTPKYYCDSNHDFSHTVIRKYLLLNEKPMKQVQNNRKYRMLLRRG